MVYPSLYAQPAFGLVTDYIGRVHTNLTIAYPPDALSTKACHVGAEKAFDYQDFNVPPRWSAISNQHCRVQAPITTPPHPLTELATEYTVPAEPQLVLPSDLRNVDPAWSNCLLFGYGAWDPPKALSKVTALLPADPITSATSITSIGSIAQPASQPSSSAITPMQTSTSATIDALQPAHESLASSQAHTISPDPPAVGLTNIPRPTDSPQLTRLDPAPGRQSVQNAPSKVSVPEISVDPAQTTSGGLGNGAVAGPLVTAAGHTMQALPNGDVSIDGIVHHPGDANVMVGSMLVSVDPTGVVLGGETIKVPTAASVPASAIPSLNGQPLQMASDGGVIIGSSTMSPGQQVTIGGTRVSVGNGNVVVGATTVPIAPATAALPSPLTTIAGHQIKADPNGGIFMDGSSLSPGYQTTIAGTPMSVGGSDVVIGPSTYSLPSPSDLAVAQLVQSISSGAVILSNGRTLSAGGPAATQSGKTISVLPNSAGLLVDGSTVAFPTAATASATPLVITAAGKSFTAIEGSAVAVDGTTLRVGGKPMTVQGTMVSMGSSGLVVGTSTIALSVASTGSATTGLGGLIMFGFGPVASSATSSSSAVSGGNISSTGQGPTRFEGAAGRRELKVGMIALGMIICIWALEIPQ